MRVRIRFAKIGKVRWTSHRDVARMWERAIRRAQLPIAYSEGYSPRPKVHFGLALSTGHEGLAEYLDIDLVDDDAGIDVAGLPERLSPLLPAGVDATAAIVIAPGTPSLQQAVTSCSWDIEVRGIDPTTLAGGIDAALAATELPLTRQRKGKDVTDDVRPYLLDLAVTGPTDDGTALDAHLATQPRGLRIPELLAVLGDGLVEGHVCRTHQWTLTDGARHEPIPAPAGATSAPHAERRAS